MNIFALMVKIFVRQSDVGCSAKVKFLVPQGVEICPAQLDGEENCAERQGKVNRIVLWSTDR